MTPELSGLVDRYGHCRANVSRFALGSTIHYLVMTEPQDQGNAFVFTNVEDIEIPDPDGSLWSTALAAKSEYDRHYGNTFGTEHASFPPGTTLNELVNGYHRPIPDIDYSLL